MKKKIPGQISKKDLSENKKSKEIAVEVKKKEFELYKLSYQYNSNGFSLSSVKQDFLQMCQNFVCFSCSVVPMNPSKCKQCGISLCEECIKTFKLLDNELSECPNSSKNHALNVVPFPFTIANIISKIKVYCPFADLGCKKEILVQELKDHTQHCDFAEIICLTCNQNLVIQQFPTHFIDCELKREREVVCIYCNETLNLKKINEHIKTCESFSENCNFCYKNNIMRKDKEKHLCEECESWDFLCEECSLVLISFIKSKEGDLKNLIESAKKKFALKNENTKEKQKELTKLEKNLIKEINELSSNIIREQKNLKQVELSLKNLKALAKKKMDDQNNELSVLNSKIKNKENELKSLNS